MKGGGSMYLSEDESLALEYLIRRVYGCDRGGVMNVAEADKLKNHPMLAPIVIFAPLYLEQKNWADIDEFMDKYCDFYYHEADEISKDFVKSFINDLKALVNKYYPITEN